MNLLDLLLVAIIILGGGAQTVWEYRRSRHRVWFLAMVAGGLAVGALLYVYLDGQPWVVAGTIALIFGAEILFGRVRGKDLAPVHEERTEHVSTPEEIRVRAAAERAERDLAARGSHPLGHPGSGGRFGQ